MTVKYVKHTLWLFLCLSYSAAVIAIDPVYTRGSGNVAIRGYDTVAYFTNGKAMKGSKDYSYQHLEAIWRFSSEANRQLFIKNPEKYMPQYGGYCAYAIAKDTTASTKPNIFKIYDDKLYLNYSSGVQKRWLKKMEKHIEDADKNWPKIREK